MTLSWKNVKCSLLEATCRVGEHWAQLRRNSTYGLRVANSPSSLISFCSPFYFPANDCCLLVSRSTFPCFLFLLHSLQFFVLPVLSCTSPPKILLSMPGPGPSSSVLRTSFPLLIFPVFPCIEDFIYCVSNVLFFTFCFTGIFLKNVFVLDELFFFIDLVLVYPMFFVFALNLMHRLCLFAFLS